MIGISRSRRSTGRFIVAKVILFFVGAAVFVAAVLLKRDDFVLFAIPFLLAGIILRFFERAPEEDPEPEEAEEDPAEDDEGAAT